MKKKKKIARLVVDDEDFIEEPDFDRKDITAREGILNFGLIFLAVVFLVGLLVYVVVDRQGLSFLTSLDYTDWMFTFTIVYMVLKSFFINILGIMCAMIYTFKDKTLYEGDDVVFDDRLLILFIIYSIIVGIGDMYLYGSLVHGIIFGVVNILTILVLFPSLIKDIERLYIY